jgi:hypothetical protein
MISAPDRSPGSSTSGTDLRFIALLTAFVALLFHDVVFGGVLFWSDTHLTFEPLFGQLGDGLTTGRILWSPLIGTGKPILANPTQATMYPPNLLFAVLPAHVAITILTVLHVLVGSIGAFSLARRVDLENHLALLSGLVFAGAGVTLSVTPYVGLSWCTAWLPWLLVHCDRVFRGEGTTRSVILLAAVAFMTLTVPEPFILIAAGLGVALWLVGGWMGNQGEGWERARTSLVLPGVAVAVAAVAASPFLIAMLLNVSGSVRALGFTWEGITIWSLHPLRLVECLAPGIFGVLGRPGHEAIWATAMVPVKGFFYLPSLYIGAPALAMLAAGIRTSSRRRSSSTLWLVLLLLLALGRWGPLYPLLQFIPGIDAARFPVKWLVPAVVPLSLLVGCGAKHVLERREVRSRNTALAVLTLTALGLVAMTAAVRFRWFTAPLEVVLMGNRGTFSAEIGATVTTACIRGLMPAVAALALVIASSRAVRSRTVIGGFALLVAIDLFVANVALIDTTDATFYDREPEALKIVRSDPDGFQRIRVDENASGALQWALSNPPLAELARFQRQTLAGYVAASHGIPLALTRDTEATGSARVYFLKVLGETAPPREQAMVYGSAAITHLVTDRDIEDPAYHLIGSCETVAGTTIRVYRNTLTQPRVAVIPAVIPYEGDQGYREVVARSSSGLFSFAALVGAQDLSEVPHEILALTPSDGDSLKPVRSTVEIIEDRGHRLTIEVETDTSAMLVVSDVYLPRWSARVDGRDAPLLRVNYCFRGVYLEEGRHSVEMVYSPWRR